MRNPIPANHSPVNHYFLDQPRCTVVAKLLGRAEKKNSSKPFAAVCNEGASFSLCASCVHKIAIFA